MPQFTEVSTVNATAEYQRRYDSAIHRRGCPDAAKAERFGRCTLYHFGADNAEHAREEVDADYADTFGSDHGFIIHVYPCCARAE